MIRVSGLSHQFDDGVWGLTDVSLTVGEGQFVVIAGANGAGKTLLMRHLVGLARPTAGQILFDGRDIFEDLAKVRRAVGLVFQDSSSQLVGLTVEEEVAFGPRNWGLSRAEVSRAVDDALNAVGLADFRRAVCSRLSGGERRRLAIAGILAVRPRVLLLDEPFTGLDYPSVKAVLETLVALHDQGVSVVVLTHELEKCLAHAQSLILLSQGRVLAAGEPSSVWDRLAEAQTYRPTGGPERIREMTWLAPA